MFKPSDDPRIRWLIILGITAVIAAAALPTIVNAVRPASASAAVAP